MALPAGLTIQNATPQDAEAIARTLEESFAPFKPQYTAQAYRATVLSPAEIIDRLDEGPTWIAADTSALIGTVSALVTPEGLYIRSMAVTPTAQSRGVARELLDTVEEFARRNGITHLYLSTTPFLLAAIALYERSGFHHTPTGPTDLFGSPLFTMSKVLD